MKKTILLLAGLLVLPAIARAQAQVTIQLGLPVVLPQLIVVSPGVQVVPDAEEEVFFVDNYYWCRHDGGWYRSRSHRSGWVLVPGRAVPARLVQIPPGRYRRWHPERRPEPVRYERRDRHEDDDHDHDRGHGHGHDKDHDHGRGHDKHDD